MSYVTPQPQYQTAFPDSKQQNILRRVYERLTNLESVTNLQGFSDGRTSPAPPPSQLAVSVNAKVTGQAFARIVNPELLQSHGNPIVAPIYHWLRASPVANFSAQVTDFGVSSHTYWPIAELGSGTFHFELRSSFDKKTWNGPV